MTKSSFIKSILLGLSVLFFGLTINSCRKEGATIAKIKVVDIDGLAVSNAQVRLYATPTIPPPNAIIIDDTLFTNTNGYAIFDYSKNYNLGQAGLLVLDIEVLSDLAIGEGIIRIDEEKMNEQTVIVQ